VQPDRSVPTRSFRRLVQAGWARYIEGRIRGWGDSSRLKFRRNSFPLVSNGKLLQKNPELRYQTAAELRDDLQRLAEGSPKARRGGKLGITVMAVVVAAAIGVLLWQHMQGKPLTDKDVLVLSDFTNSTGDPVFDGTLREGLAIQLEQSPFLKIMDEEQVQRDLRRMSLPPGGHIRPDE
jgi:hypothetical protein